jgi:hypothetical protein
VAAASDLVAIAPAALVTRLQAALGLVPISAPLPPGDLKVPRKFRT